MFERSFHDKIFALTRDCAHKKATLLSEELEDWPEDGLWERWGQSLAPCEHDKLKRRIQWDDLDPGEVLRVTKERKAISGEDQKCFSDAFSMLSSHASSVPMWISPGHWNKNQHPFVDLWAPAYDMAVSLLKDHVEKRASSNYYSYGAITDLAASLVNRLARISERTLWHEFNEQRRPGVLLAACLKRSLDEKSEPPREFYQQFIRKHQSDGFQSLCKQYPVWGRLVGSTLHNWLEGSIEMLDRITYDRHLLRQYFRLPPEWPLISVETNLGDLHHNGRAVSILTFQGIDGERCGSSVRIVYKPKPLDLDKAYAEAISDLNSSSDLPRLKTASICSCSGYGYVEYLHHDLCRDNTELSRFYYNAGRLAAILHVLGCTDCHHENLIAVGSQLVLIDVETLFEGNFLHPADYAIRKSSLGPDFSLDQRFRESVLRLGLLPKWTLGNSYRSVCDVSALGISPPQYPEEERMGWVNINSDGMMPGKVLSKSYLPTSLPVGIGMVNPWAEHLDVFCNGFTDQSYDLIRAKTRWLRSGGVLEQFRNCTRRIVLRPTRIYYAIQDQQLSPAALSSSLAQGMVLEQLARVYLLYEQRPHHWPVFEAEVKAMQQLDIPHFSHRIGDDKLLCNHRENLAVPMQGCGLMAAYSRLQQLNKSLIDFELQLVRGISEASNLISHDWRNPTRELDSRDSQDEQALNEISCSLEPSIVIADRLLSQAISDNSGQVQWLGMNLLADGQHFSFGPLGQNLYGGSCGIASFFHALRNEIRTHDSSGMDPHTLGLDRAIDQILTPIRELVSRESHGELARWWRDQPLGLNGCGGILLALYRLGETNVAEKLIAFCHPRFVKRDNHPDVINGCAGLIGPLLLISSKKAVKLAITAGDYILERLGLSENSGKRQGSPLLLGFSHGAAGYSAALTTLYRVSREIRFLSSARQLIAYERSHYDPSKGNWPDFRRGAVGFMTSWCNGAPGIALGRACLWGTLNWDEHCEQEIALALRTTRSATSYSDHICCGTAGLVATMRLLLSGPWPLTEEVITPCHRAIKLQTQQLIQRCQDTSLDLRCYGTSRGSLLLPGLFTGLSGIGLALMNTVSSNADLAVFLSAGLWPLSLSEGGFRISTPVRG